MAKNAVDAKKYFGLLICGDFNFWYVRWAEDGTVDVLKSTVLWIRNLKWKMCSIVGEYREIRKEIKKITKRSVRAFEESIARD